MADWDVKTPQGVPLGLKWEVMAIISAAYMNREPFDPDHGIIPAGGGLWPWIDEAAEKLRPLLKEPNDG